MGRVVGFGPKSDDLGHRNLKSDFGPSHFVPSECIRWPILFSDRKVKIWRLEADRIMESAYSLMYQYTMRYTSVRHASTVCITPEHLFYQFIWCFSTPWGQNLAGYYLYPELLWVLYNIHTRTCPELLWVLYDIGIRTRNFSKFCTPVPQHPELLEVL